MVSYTMLFIRSLQLSVLILFFLTSLNVAYSAPTTSKRTSESSKDLIEKARNLILQKDRAQALNILVSAMKREPANSAAFKEMKKALEEISNAFLNDRSQQLYELALSLRQTDQKQSQARLQEALRVEPDNLQIINELARQQIMSNNCDNAMEILSQARKTNPFDEQSILTSSQAAVCLQEWPEYTALRSQADERKGIFKTTWLALEVERADREGSESRAQEALGLLKTTNPTHPEISYWDWKFGKNPEAKKGAGVKYLMFCKNLTTALVRKYLNEVYLCHHVSEVENAPKNGGQE